MCNKDCFHCPYDDCIRDERQDQRDRDKELYQQNKQRIRERQKARYWNNVDASREYHKNKASENYDRDKNTSQCRKWREKNIEAKREYDRLRYQARKEKHATVSKL